MISFHLNTQDTDLHHIYTKFESGDDCGRPSYISKVITRCVNSPIVWKGGVRKAANFDYADWLVLDFDDGMKLKDAWKEFNKYRHVIGTTKSHQKPKGSDGKVCDRFRVWIKLMFRCHNLDDFTYTTKQLAKKFGADCQAIDGARKYLPCEKIVSCDEGVLLRIEKFVPEYKPKKAAFTARTEKFIPEFIRQMLNGNVENGQRNYACYTIAKYLYKNGFSESEILNIITESAVPDGSASPREIQSAVRNGIRA